MVDEFTLGVILDTQKAMHDLRMVESERQRVEAGLRQTQENTNKTKINAIEAFQIGWGVTRGILKIAGISISGVTNAIINSVLAVGAELYKLAHIQAVTPGMQISAALTIASAITTIASAVSFENDAQQAMNIIHGTNAIISEVNWIIGRLNY